MDLVRENLATQAGERALGGHLLADAVFLAAVLDGDEPQAGVDLGVGGFDLLFLGDGVEDEVEFEVARGPLGAGAADVGHAFLDLLDRDAAVLEVHELPLEEPVGVAFGQVLGQVEGDGGQEPVLDGGLLGAAEGVVALGFLLAPQGGPKRVHVLVIDGGQEGRIVGQGDAGDGVDLDAQLGRLATHVFVVGIVADGDGGGADIAGLGTLEQVGQVVETDALDGDGGDGEADVLVVDDHDVAGLDGEAAADEVVLPGLAAFGQGVDAAVLLAEAIEAAGDGFVGHLGPLDLVDGDGGVIGGQVELGADLQIDGEGHGALVGQLDLLGVDLGLADDVEFLLVDGLLEALRDEFGADLLGDGVAEPLLDEPPRRPPRTEPRDEGLALEFVEPLVELLLDLLARYRDREPLLARRNVFNRNVHP